MNLDISVIKKFFKLLLNEDLAKKIHICRMITKTLVRYTRERHTAIGSRLKYDKNFLSSHKGDIAPNWRDITPGGVNCTILFFAADEIDPLLRRLI